MAKTISAGRTPKFLIERVDGDLSLVGWDGEDALIKADEEALRVEQSDEQVTINCADDLSMRVPKGASIFVQSVSGDVSMRGVLGAIELKEIEGDLSLRDVESVSVGTLQADLSLRSARGNVFVKKAQGDVAIRDVQGHVTLESVADDLVLRDVRGDVTANVAEDVVFYLNPQAGRNYTIHAGDDILLVLPPQANATLTMTADEIDLDWKNGVQLEEGATSGVVTLGNGSAQITLNAGCDIRVSNELEAGESAGDFGNFAGMGVDWSGNNDWSDMGARISRQVAQATKRAAESGRRAEEAGRRVEEAGRRAAERVQAAQKRVEERINRKINIGVGRWNWDVSPKGAPMPPAKPQASDEERRAILKMLQEKKITAEDADKLLAALEGDA
ncbi:MAG: DUF4097 family beta strand repeat protein [Anaerolineales bacterium]|nr:DUF4097 family beta strand repeat protein [Anaerolineales bacterium]